jgi:nucleoside recognition membrane protein YjiH
LFYTEGRNRLKKFNLSTWLLFLLPSIAGVILFMIPLKFGEEWKVPIAKLADMLSGVVAPIMPWVATIVLIIAALGSVILLFTKKDGTKPSFIVGLFKVSLFWTIVRVVGAIFAVLVILKLGPEPIWNENTGGLLLSSDGLVTFLFTIFLFAGLLLPLLLNFGLL